MTDWDLLTPGIGLTSIGIVGVGISLAGIAETFIDGMHAVSLLTMFIGMIFLASGLFKDGFPSTGRAKSATFITLGFLVTFGGAAAVTASTQTPSILAYIGLMMIISIPAAVLAVASYRQVPYLRALAVIFISAAVVGGSTFYAFGLVTPRPPATEEEGGNATAPEGSGNATTSENATAPANVVSATIPAGASAQGNPAYDPDPLSVNKGDGAEWTNEDNTPHTVTSKQQGVFDSSLINAGDKWLLNTAEIDAGEYDYYCTLHPNMVGVLTVAEGGAAPAEGTGNATSGASNATGGNQTAGNQTSVAGNQTGANQTATGNATAGNQTAAGNATGSGNQTAGGNGTGAAPSGGTQVSITSGSSTKAEDAYDPNPVEASVGDTVTWTNDDSQPHTVTSGSNGQPDGTFDSSPNLNPLMAPGQTFEHTFEEPGEFPYYCAVHPNMVGTVNVS
jgi:plastocyanin